MAGSEKTKPGLRDKLCQKREARKQRSNQTSRATHDIAFACKR